MLTKEDLKEIGKIITTSETKLTGIILDVKDELHKEIKGTEKRLDERITKLDAKLDKTKEELEKKIDDTKEEITEIINREVSDLSDINRAVLVTHDQLDYRLRIVERKLGIKA